MTAGEGQKAFVRRGAVAQIGLEHALDRLRRIIGFDVVKNLAAAGGVGAKTAADVDVIALDLIAVLGHLHLGANEADVADVMLRAGIRAAGEMDVERAVELHAGFAPVRDLLGMALGVGQSEPAAGTAGAGDEAGADRRRLGRQPDRFDSGFSVCHALLGNARDHKVLPDREPDIAVAEFFGDLADAAHLLGGNLAHRKDDAEPMKALLLLRVWTDVSEAVEWRSCFKGFLRCAGELVAELVFHRGQEFLETPGVEDVFEPRLGAVGAVAVVDEDAHYGIGHPGGIFGLDDDAGSAGEVLMTGDAAEHELEPDARFDAEAVLHRDGLKTDVVGVFQHRDQAAAVKADVELAWDAVERAVVEDVEMPFAGIRPGIDQLLRIDPRGRRAGDVADIVGAGAARA